MEIINIFGVQNILSILKGQKVEKSSYFQILHCPPIIFRRVNTIY